VLRAVSDEECLSWGLELSDAVLGTADATARSRLEHDA